MEEGGGGGREDEKGGVGEGGGDEGSVSTMYTYTYLNSRGVVIDSCFHNCISTITMYNDITV